MADSRGASVNARLQDRAIRHAAYWQRTRAHEVADMRRFIDGTVMPRVRDRVATRLAAIERRGGVDSGPWTTAHLQALQTDLRDVVTAGMRAAHDRLSGNLVDLGEYEAQWQTGVLNALTPDGIDFVAPSPTLIRSAVRSDLFNGSRLEDWWGGIAADSQRRIADALRSGVIEGRTTDEIARSIVGDDGVLALTRNQADTLVRTATTQIATEARDLTYQENDDIVKGYVVVETLDERTCPQCGAEDGKEYALGDDHKPPFHPGCRGTTTPILKSFAELGIPAVEFTAGERASMDGAVPAKTTWQEWIGRQSAKVQDEALGPGRAALLRSGVPIEHFVGGDGRPLSLRDLKALEN